MNKTNPAPSHEWKLSPLRELGQWLGGGTPSKYNSQYWNGGTIPWVSPKDMKKDRILDTEDHITELAISESSVSRVPAGSVLMVTRSGILRHYLPVAVTAVPVTVNQDLKVLIPNQGVSPDYVAWALRTFSQNILTRCSKQGTTVNSLETSELLHFEIPIAPYERQLGIVAEIEKQFSRLDEAVTNLKRIKAKLKRYKAAVLKAAVEGKLTEQWRKDHPDVEPADKLLDRILDDRRIRCNRKGKCQEPHSPEVSNLRPLPTGWHWATLGQLSWDAGYGTSAKCDYDFDGPPVLRIPNIDNGRIDLGDLKFASSTAKLTDSESLSPPDLLIIRTNGSKDLIGRSAIVRQSFRYPHFFASYLIRFRIIEIDGLTAWLNCIWDSQEIRQWITDNAGSSAGQYNISLRLLNRLPILIPPQREQQTIIEEVDRHISVIRELETTTEANLKRVNHLRQSILQQAFTGQISIS